MNADDSLQYEATDPIEKPLAVGLGLQLAVLTLNSTVQRMEAASEETLLILIESRSAAAPRGAGRKR